MEIKDKNIERIKLLDLVDENILEHLLAGFCEKCNSRMKIVYYDSEGELKYIKENEDQAERLWSNICQVYRNNCETCKKMCDISNLMAAAKLFNSGNPEKKYFRCEPLGMINMIAPIKVRHEVIGAVIFGQQIFDNEVDSLLKKICEKYPQFKNEYELAFQKEKMNERNQNTICSLKDIERLLEELQNFADLIGAICEKVKTLEDEKNHRETFFERVSHTISLPMSSILIDTANLLEEIDSEDVRHLFHEVQGLNLVIQNTLHGSNSSITIQEGEKKFVKKHITTPLKDACEMFGAEAKDKGCDLDISISIGDNTFQLEINELKDINFIYKKIINKIFDSFPKGKSHYTIRKKNNDLKKVNISELVEYCYLNQGETFDVLDAVTNDKIEFDFSQLSEYYLPPIEMNPEIMQLAFKNLLHNAVKYSYESSLFSRRRYVSIKCFFYENNIGVAFENYGVGITEKEITEGKIWQARYRGYLSQDRNRCGAGLGLPHAKLAIENVHNGKISCSSIPLGGGAYLTKFTINFNKPNNK
jgi:signal transduction histidine kinase